MYVCMYVSKSHYFCIQRIWPFLLFLDTFPFSKVDRKNSEYEEKKSEKKSKKNNLKKKFSKKNLKQKKNL